MDYRRLTTRYSMCRVSRWRRATAFSCASRPVTQNLSGPKPRNFCRGCMPRACMKSKPKLAATNSSRLRRAGLLAAPLAMAALTFGCRLDMHEQPKYKPLAETGFFDDQRSERPVVEGTVARGELRVDEQLYTGKVNGQDAETFPFPITRADLERGRERFE